MLLSAMFPNPATIFESLTYRYYMETTMGGESSFNRAVVYTEPGTTKTEVVELPIPKPGPGEVLVRL